MTREKAVLWAYISHFTVRCGSVPLKSQLLRRRGQKELEFKPALTKSARLKQKGLGV
jgi:hypothetical protein